MEAPLDLDSLSLSPDVNTVFIIAPPHPVISMVYTD